MKNFFTIDSRFNFLRLWAKVLCLSVGLASSGVSFGQQVKNITRNTTFSTIQGALNDAATVNGDVIEVGNGTYNENVVITKSVTVQGVSTAAIIKAPYNGTADAVIIGTNDVTLKNLTVTRDFGADTTAWYACTVNQGINFNSRSNVRLEGLIVTGNRNGIYCANSPNATIVNCIIEDNRTGIQFTHDVSGLSMTNNIVRNNFTHGIVFNLDTSPINATNAKIQNNSITGNWYSQLNFQRNAHASNTVTLSNTSFACNWFGVASPAINAISAGEPGYVGQKPSQFGGTNPGLTNRYIVGTQANSMPYTPALEDGTDTKTAIGFQPVGNTCTPVINTTRNTYFATIQAAINASSTLAGDTLALSPGVYNEQALVNKALVIKNAEATKPEISFTGTPALASGKLTTFEVTSANVTIEGLKFKVDLAKLRSGIVASAANLNNLTIKDNEFIPYRTGDYLGTYGLRNAVSVNYGDYRIGGNKVSGILYTGNIVRYDKGADSTNLTTDDAGFRSGISVDEGGGVFTGNTLQAISQDIEVRFSNIGDVTVSNNTFNGGGSEISEHNAGAGVINITGNTFNGKFGNTYSSQLRLKNNQANIVTNVSKNTFVNTGWGISMENYKNAKIDSNSFTPMADSLNYQLITVNTKLNSSSSSTIVQTAIGATITNNVFNGSGVLGGKAISFYNQDSDNDVYGTFEVGTSGNENTFNAKIKNFIYFDGSTGTSTGYKFAGSNLPNYPGTNNWPTTMAPWAENLNVRYNKFDLGAGLKSPMSMSFAERETFETMLVHKPDNAALGQISYFNPVHNLTQDTYFATIQPAITAAAAGDTLELSEWTYTEGITVNKPLTIQGVDSANVVLNGATISNANGITLAQGIENITIKKLTVKNFKGSGSTGTGIYGIKNNNLVIDQVVLDGNEGRGGIFLGGSGGIENVSITNSISKNHAVAASRGIVIWDGFKKNITISNNRVYNNNCCGIELQDGTASGVTITGNYISGNVDNGLGLTGLTIGAGANIINNNTVINNGRFGIEIKNSNGTGLTTGDGSILVKGNTVSLAASTSMNIRDHAGISVYRRAFLNNNSENYPNIPTGVVIDSNTVSGFKQLNTSAVESKGYGIVVEGTNHKVSRNTISGNDVAIQEQGGLHPNAGYVLDNTGDGDQSDNKSANYFGRGNSPVACSNTFTDNSYSTNTTDMNSVVGTNSYAMVVNKRNRETFCSIQAAVSDSHTLAGDTLQVSSGVFNEQVLINKAVVIIGVGATKPEVSFTGTPALASGKLTTFEVTSPNVTIEGLKFKVDLAKLNSGIVASAANLSNLTVKNNEFVPYRTGAYLTPYGLRNAVSVNYGDYRVGGNKPSGILYTGNIVRYDKGADSTNLTADDAGFRSGISVDEGGGVFTGNTLQAISQDIEVRFSNIGDVTVSNNIFNGGGSEISEHNAGAGVINITGNTFNGKFGNTYSSQLRLKNNQANIVTNVSKNTFLNTGWGISMENYKNAKIDSNSFTPMADSLNYQLITVNTKLNSSSSSTIVQTAIGATITNNVFNGSGAVGGKAISFYNQDSDNDVYGTFEVGTSGNENTFNAKIKNFIYFDGSTGTSTGYKFAGSNLPNYPGTNNWPTTMAPWAENLNVRYNKFDLGAGLKSPMNMDFAERTLFEEHLTHKPDNAALGQISYFNPVHNLTQNTYFASIQPAIDAAASGDTLELSQWMYAEGITINKPLTIQGLDSANVILNGSSLANANGITLAQGIENITIKKLTIKNFKGSGSTGTGIYGTRNNNLVIDQVVLDGNEGRGGIFLSGGGGIENVSITNSISKNHAVAASRGIVIWDGFKKNITISNNRVYNNNCCGIELQDGTASGITITGNYVSGNVDNGIGLTGLTAGAGANIVNNNTVINNGRFGIEIKNPNGTGLTTGDGSVIVKGNTVSLAASGSMNNRDHAGISVYRRGFLNNNSENYANIPTGVVIDSNKVSGFRQMNSSAVESKGYGIVVEGTNHKVSRNTVSSNDIGIQEQGGLHPNAGYVIDNLGDGDQADNKSLNYFGRGNSPVACGNIFTNNTFNANLTTNMNTVVGSNSFALVVNKRNRETFCSIQAAVGDSHTMDGDTIVANAGTYLENITVAKSVIVLGPNANINPNTGTRVAEAIIRPAVRQTSLDNSTSGTIIRVGGTGHIDVTIKGFKLDGNNPALSGGRSLNGVNVHTGAGIVNSIGSFDTNPGGADATMIIQNNIIQNVERYGVLADGTVPAKAIAGTNVSYNKFDNIPSGDNFGGGRGRAAAFEENHYGTFAYNVATRVNVGWQNDNYHLASPGAGTVVEHNNIRTYRRGIFHNLQYQNATAARIANNTITKETSGDYPASDENFGVELASIQSTVSAASDSNNVSGMKYGILLWNTPSTGTVKISGGTLTGNQYGIMATSNDPQFAGAGNASSAIISGVNVVNSTSAGIVLDNSTNNSAVSLALGDSTIISGGPKGLLLTGANTTIAGGTLNNTTFTGQTGNHIELVNSTGDMDGGNAIFGSKKAIAMTQVERVALEGKLLHKPDNAALGKVCLPNVSTFAIKAGSPSTYCNGSSTILVANIIGANGPYTLIYTDGTVQTTVNNYVSGTDIPVSPTTTKTYSLVSVSDATGCSTTTGFSAAFTVTVNPIPAKPTITPASIAICQGSSTTLTASACPGGTLNWTGGKTGTSISVSVTSSYKVACTQLGCTSDSSDVATVTVNLVPTKPTITPVSTAICVGSSTTLTASACTGGTLKWTGGLTGTSITVSPTASKSYKVACTQLNCTSDSSSATLITVNPIPAAPSIITTFSTICQGDSTTLSVLTCAGGTVNWTGGLTGASVKVAPSQTKAYKATCTRLSCTSDSSAVSTITVKPRPAAPTIVADNNTICNGQTVLLTGTCTTGTFAWVVASASGVTSDASNTRMITSPGTYNATCTNNGCVSSQGSITITTGSCRFLSISPSNPSICPGANITLTTSGCTSGNITWAGGATGTGASITVAPTITSTYLAMCSSGGSASVTVNVAESTAIVTTNVSTGVVLVKAAQTVESDKKVGNPAFTPMPNVTYQAGGSILLKPGFVVEPGAVFTAEIKGCN